MSAALRNIVVNALAPGRFSVMANKVLRRLEPDTRASALAWAESTCIEIEDYCSPIDPALWNESQGFMEEADRETKERLDGVPNSFTPSGANHLIYFLVRRHRPKALVETGVSAGTSSRAMLEAIERNGIGRLYSSDFPLFREERPERFIGCAVPKRLRENWELDLRGDDAALPDFAAKAGPIDFFHYDSDKSMRGRRRAMELIWPSLSPDAVVLMDDIQDNVFFRDYVTENGRPFLVFQHRGKFIGALGLN